MKSEVTATYIINSDYFISDYLYLFIKWYIFALRKVVIWPKIVNEICFFYAGFLYLCKPTKDHAQVIGEVTAE